MHPLRASNGAPTGPRLRLRRERYEGNALTRSPLTSTTSQSSPENNNPHPHPSRCLRKEGRPRDNVSVRVSLSTIRLRVESRVVHAIARPPLEGSRRAIEQSKFHPEAAPRPPCPPRRRRGLENVADDRGSCATNRGALVADGTERSHGTRARARAHTYVYTRVHGDLCTCTCTCTCTSARVYLLNARAAIRGVRHAKRSCRWPNRRDARPLHAIPKSFRRKKKSDTERL